MYTRVFQKRHFKKNKTSTPARNWGVPRKFISRRKCWSHKSRGLAKWLKVWQNRRRRRDDRDGEIDISFNWNEVETVPSFRIGGEMIEKEVESEVQEQREERGRGRKSSFENGRGSLGRSWSKMAKRRRWIVNWFRFRGVLLISEWVG